MNETIYYFQNLTCCFFYLSASLITRLVWSLANYLLGEFSPDANLRLPTGMVANGEGGRGHGSIEPSP